MAKFFDPQAATSDSPDLRLHAPATARNRDVILDILKNHLPAQGTVLEFASGTGEHACHFASGLPTITWQPSDIDTNHLSSINAWRDHLSAGNVNDPIHLDATTDWPTIDGLAAICAINLIHISPWIVCKSLIEGANHHLPSGGMLFLYGPYKRSGVHTAPSNQSFDTSLQARNSEWGVRDMETVTELAAENGFQAPIVIPMPANNFSLIFKKH